jgi:hypothetical protein
VGTNPPKEKVRYTREEIVALPEWFEPLGKASEFYPTFPSLREFFDDSNGHCSLGETRHNDMCRVCQLLSKIDNSRALKAAVYHAYKMAYEEQFAQK